MSACGARPAVVPGSPGAAIYPETPRGEHLDLYHDVQVADPYRWLETDDEQTRRWIEAQNALAQPYLESIPARERIKNRLTQLWNYERQGLPAKYGGRYFFLHNDGSQNQSVLYVKETADAVPRVVLDPNTFSADATVALGEFVSSPDGRRVAYSLSDGGTDWRSWHVRDVESGQDLPDELRFIKFVPVVWTKDSRSMYYARYPQRIDGHEDDTRQREIFRHRLGETQNEDERIFVVTDHPTRNPFVQMSDDGRYLIIWLYDGSQSTGIYYFPLAEDGSPGDLVRLFDSFDADYRFVAEIDDVFYVYTTAHAPNARLIAVPAAGKRNKKGDPEQAPVSTEPLGVRVIVPEKKFAMAEVTIVGGRIIAQYLQEAHSLVQVLDLDGQPLYQVKLPGLGQAAGFAGDVQDPETFFIYTDFLTPASVIRLDAGSGRTQIVHTPRLEADMGQFVTEQVFYSSRDGTRVPMFITHRRDLQRDGQAPLMLYGYGGFGIPLQPEFSVPVLVWLEMGGVYAVANLRGGSEYGEAWHSAGTKLQKQNVFDDFISAAQWLIEKKYTSTPKLAIRGRSNGGLLVGAVLTQRPELFGAALPAVGVLDMLRYHTPNSNARQWSSDYGLSENAAEFAAQYAYSPVHNAHRTCYPPTLVTTADRDDRVVPWHSYKFAAALQYAQSCAKPILLRVETRAGHGTGKPVWMQIEDYADQWAFLVKSLEMN
ncbi:prolyl endopeptidase [Steroidobacter denitrificans]|uniref:prolyl oligopeptidase n=1 Tax=Steroidobacter denitrificans TaxID=465721 RepID=A0A127F5Y8_STEDE|nr:prolyl endopeptidase [Steroidobacter denitrificans]